MKRAVILGASRGLGAQLATYARAEGWDVTGLSRKVQAQGAGFTAILADFTKAEGQETVLQHVLQNPFKKLFYVAGGGPFGLFHERSWKDHQWALEVSFLFPAKLLHALACAGRFQQTIIVGSSIAESDADPMAASYAAAKHALKGLVLSLRQEYPQWDLRLFSPGYMDTDMLPPNAAVRKPGVYDPAVVARELWTWALAADKSGHKVYPRYSPKESS